MSKIELPKNQEEFDAKFPKAALTEQEFKERYMAKAKKVKTMEDFQALYKEIEGFKHDYGTIVYGCLAVMSAAFTLLNNSPTGGITGFQAGCLGWELIREYMMVGKGPLKLVSYENLLYPQYEDKFAKTIDSDTAKWLRDEAAKKLTESPAAHPDVQHHWRKVAEGWIPFGFTVKED